MKRIQSVSKRGLGTALLMALLGMLAPPIMASDAQGGGVGLFSDEVTKNPPYCYLIGQYSQARLICYP